jgi:hypothetical protein
MLESLGMPLVRCLLVGHCRTATVFDAPSIDDKAIWGMYRYTWNFTIVPAITAAPAAGAVRAVEREGGPLHPSPMTSMVLVPC